MTSTATFTISLILLLVGAPTLASAQDCGGVPCNEVFIYRLISDQGDSGPIGFTTDSREPDSYRALFDELGEKQRPGEWTEVDLGYDRCRPTIHLRVTSIVDEEYKSIHIQTKCDSVDVMSDSASVERLRQLLQTVICREIGCPEDVQKSEN